MHTALVGLLFQRLFNYSYFLSRYLFSLFSFQCYKSIARVNRNSLLTGFPTNIHSLLLHLRLPPAQINISVSPSELILLLSAEMQVIYFSRKHAAICTLHPWLFTSCNKFLLFFAFLHALLHPLLFFQNFFSILLVPFPPSLTLSSALALPLHSRAKGSFSNQTFSQLTLDKSYPCLNKLPQLGSHKSNYLQTYFPRSVQ